MNSALTIVPGLFICFSDCKLWAISYSKKPDISSICNISKSKNTGFSTEQSTTVLSSPSSASPPLRRASMLFFNLANTSPGCTGKLPDLFAEGAAIGFPNSCINLLAIMLFGHLKAMVSSFAVAASTTFDFFFTIMVKGPANTFLQVF